MEAELVSGSMGVDHTDGVIGAKERGVVVSAIPDDDVCLGLGAPQDVGVVDPSEHDEPLAHRSLVLLALLDRGV